ncbi:hypothetical protein HaLaN_26658 [Haematococcus lacustris]|uniref:Uncharacterized protein n=1 Tax=Haematococcus lacustris TaxID=44745 RepID=A0A6A0A6N7_HAELA|nr:hypothetical protein HaLaN_26658 [Haematococcus lacustris]
MAIEHVSITSIIYSSPLPAAALWPVLTFTTGGVSEVEQLREQLAALQRQGPRAALEPSAAAEWRQVTPPDCGCRPYCRTLAALLTPRAAASTEAASAPALGVVSGQTVAPTVHCNADVTGNGPRGGSYDGKDWVGTPSSLPPQPPPQGQVPVLWSCPPETPLSLHSKVRGAPCSSGLPLELPREACPVLCGAQARGGGAGGGGLLLTVQSRSCVRRPGVSRRSRRIVTGSRVLLHSTGNVPECEYVRRSGFVPGTSQT